MNRCRAGDSQARAELIGGSGSDEIAHQARGRTPRPQHDHRFFFFWNYGAGESRLLVAIQASLSIEIARIDTVITLPSSALLSLLQTGRFLSGGGIQFAVEQVCRLVGKAQMF